MSPQTFCRDCFKGTLRGDVELRGTEEVVHGRNTYVARPDAGTAPVAVIVIVSDAFGWELPNTRALADAYARRGPFLVYVPDFMDGHALPYTAINIFNKIEAPSPDWWTALVLKPLWYIAAGWVFLPFALRNFTSTALGHMEGFLRALRDSPPPEVIPRPPSATATAGDAQAPTEGAKSSIKIGVAGFCWGGRYAILLAGPAGSGASSGGEKLVDCVFAAHPSLVSVPQDVRAVTGTVPVSIANGPDDEWMGRKKMDELRRLLLEEPKVAGQGALAGGESVHEVVVYEGARHGFAIRGDPNDPRQAEMGMQAEDQAVAWFRKHLT